jgi:hypothetical protein
MQNTQAATQGRSFNLIGLGGIVLAGGGVWIIYKAAQKLGLAESKESKQERISAGQFDKTLSRWITDDFIKSVGADYLKRFKTKANIKNLSSLTPAQTKDFAKRIYDAKGTFNDNEEKLYSVFRELNNGIEVYQVNKQFKTLYDNRNIADYINGFTNNADRSKLYIFTREKKDYKKIN